MLDQFNTEAYTKQANKDAAQALAYSKIDEIMPEASTRNKMKALSRAAKLIRKEAKGNASAEDIAELDAFEALEDGTDAIQDAADAIKDQVLFTYTGSSISGEEFVTETNKDTEFAGKPVFVKTEVMKAIDKISEDDLMYIAALDIIDEDANFAALMDEYQNGVFIFKLQEDAVWNKLHIDSTQIFNYWKGHKENYSYPDRVSFGEIFSMKDSLIQKYYQLLKEDADFDSLAALYTERQGKKKDKGFYELQDVNFSDLSREANKIEKEGEFIEPIPFSGGYAIFKLYKRETARLKTFEEARAEVAGLVQEQESKRLADEYNNTLENIYHPVIYYDELQKAFTKKEEN